MTRSGAQFVNATSHAHAARRTGMSRSASGLGIELYPGHRYVPGLRVAGRTHRHCHLEPTASRLSRPRQHDVQRASGRRRPSATWRKVVASGVALGDVVREAVSSGIDAPSPPNVPDA
eukprot:6200996-Pleurochrysis_carterae.AAC.6